jgi:hypothetical protein
MIDPLAHEPVDDALLEELVQAHLDTIELLLEREPSVDDHSHLDYLRALVRAAKARTAAAVPG